MSLHTMIRSLSNGYPHLNSLLAVGAPGPSDGMPRGPRAVVSPAPINLDVSDLRRDIGLAAAAWEWEIRATLWWPKPCWTRPNHEAIPISLDWTARMIEDPPLIEDQWGNEWPAFLPDTLTTWITETASTLTSTLYGLLGTAPPTKAVRAPEACPRCQRRTLIGTTDTNTIRCMTAGCGYEHRTAA